MQVLKAFQRKRIVIWLMLIVGFVVVATTVQFAIKSAQLVTDRFEGKIWRLPSRVYGAPLALYPNKQLTGAVLAEYLHLLGYQERHSIPVGIGQWCRRGEIFQVGLRKYRDLDQVYQPRSIEIQIKLNRIDSIVELSGTTKTPQTVLYFPPVQIGGYSGPQREQRTLVQLKDVPTSLLSALILMEDRNFYRHFGISLRGTLRALWRNISKASVRQGGSTLTQQLMKNFFLSPKRTFSRKLKEAVMTVIAEWLYSKDRILEAYINEIYLGQSGPTSIHGFEEASVFYFSKSLFQTNVSEQALLVGLVSAPGLYSPLRDLQRSRERRNLVLRLMYEYGQIDDQEFNVWTNAPLMVRTGRAEDMRASYFLDYVRQELDDQFSLPDLEEDGLEIFTSLDPILQRYAELAVNESLQVIDQQIVKSNRNTQQDGQLVEVALLSVNPQTGAVRAMIGGRNYSLSQFNRVTHAWRQPGSAIKPLLVAAGVDGNHQMIHRVHAATLLDDSPNEFSFEGQEWQPKNFDDDYYGQVPLFRALEKSLNLAMVNLGMMVGLDTVVEYYQKFGLTQLMKVPSVILGSMEVTPWQLTQAYTVFANDGLLSHLRGVLGVLNNEGYRVKQDPPRFERVLSSESAYQILYMLQGVTSDGTARAIGQMGLAQELAGKTGTTNDYRDNWFAGFSSNLLTVVWVGFDNNESLGLTGSATALRIWMNYMKQAMQAYGAEPFAVPQDITWVAIDQQRGCRPRRRGGVPYPFARFTDIPKCRK